MKSIRKHTQNVLVDTLSLLCMLILTFTGLLIHYKLPPGSKGASVWGLSRHEWGEFHFWVAMVLIALITVLILLHIPWIKGVIYPKKDEKKKVKLMAFTITILFILAVGIAALGSPVISR